MNTSDFNEKVCNSTLLRSMGSMLDLLRAGTHWVFLTSEETGLAVITDLLDGVPDDAVVMHTWRPMFSEPGILQESAVTVAMVDKQHLAANTVATVLYDASASLREFGGARARPASVKQISQKLQTCDVLPLTSYEDSGLLWHAAHVDMAMAKSITNKFEVTDELLQELHNVDWPNTLSGELKEFLEKAKANDSHYIFLGAASDVILFAHGVNTLRLKYDSIDRYDDPSEYKSGYNLYTINAPITGPVVLLLAAIDKQRALLEPVVELLSRLTPAEDYGFTEELDIHGGMAGTYANFLQHRLTQNPLFLFGSEAFRGEMQRLIDVAAEGQ